MRKQLLALVLAATAALSGGGVAMADSPPVQVAGQTAATSQQAGAASSATQSNPSNTNISIRVLSPGNDGDVAQVNSVASSAAAGNTGSTNQSAGQSQGAGGGIQSSQQNAGTSQLAAALSAAQQVGASNTNVPVRVLSPGNAGSVTQTNSTGSRADAGNAASTGQTSSQDQAGSGCECGGGGGIQTADQGAATEQAAGALSTADQVDPSNTAVSVRVLSPGNDGSVTQSNTAASSAAAGNTAGTWQGSSQTQAGAKGCGCEGTPVQQAQQHAGTGQEAGALSGAAQAEPSNEASPVGVKSHGGAGSVSQENGVGSSATSGNRAGTGQAATQSDGSGNGIQIAGQQAATGQAALAESAALQYGASNDASPVRVLSPGGGGSVSQSNSAASSAAAGNDAATTQRARQDESGGRCGCDGLGIQALGQKAGTEQVAGAASEAVQLFHPSECGCGGSGSGNVASPVRVGSGGSDGHVRQDNSVASSATAGNRASTGQDGSQRIGGGGLAIQALGQEAATGQAAEAFSAAAAVGRVERRVAGARAQPGGRWQRRAVEHRGVVRGVRERRRNPAARPPGDRRRLRVRRDRPDPGARAVRGDVAARLGRLGGGAAPPEQRRLAGPRLEPGLRGARAAGERQRVERHVREPLCDRTGRVADELTPSRRRGLRAPPTGS